jgi:parallel beta-helix repeat protein
VHVYSATANDGAGVNDNVVRGNVIYNWQFGVILSSGSRNVAYENILYDNQTEGISVKYGCADCVAHHNTIHDNGGPGIHVYQSATGTVLHDNVVYGNGIADTLDDNLP